MQTRSMFLLDKLNDICTQKVEKYGAQYVTFAIFGIINYPIELAYEYYAGKYHGIIIRAITTLLCIILLLKDHWPTIAQKYIPLYWYITAVISLPLLGTYLLLHNDLSLSWLINFNIGILISALILDAASFLFVQAIGIVLGISIFYAMGNYIYHLPTHENVHLFLYMFLCTIIVCYVFSRNREVFNHLVQTQLEESVRQRTKELQDALDFKTQYLNNMSHEIRTPVHGFWNFSMILVDQWNSFTDEKRFELASQISKNAEKLKNIVSNLLDLSKHSANKWVVHPEKFDISSMVSDIVDEATSLYAKAYGKNINIDWKPQSMEVEADKELLAQVLRNLFANAVKFSPQNGEFVVTLEQMSFKDLVGGELAFNDNMQDMKARFIHFSLKDNGPGIPESEVSSIFDAFIQSSRTNTKAGGTGLGLAICKKAIELHHGIIFAENNADYASGSTFHFIIPVTYSEDAKSLVEIEREHIDEDRPDTIVIIDDEENVVLTVALMLGSSGYIVQGFTKVLDGVKYIRDHHDSVNVILLDLMMPELSGLDVMAMIVNDKKLQHIPIILQSGMEDSAAFEQAKSIGAYKCIKKPYSKKMIVDLIKEVGVTSSSSH